MIVFMSFHWKEVEKIYSFCILRLKDDNQFLIWTWFMLEELGLFLNIWCWVKWIRLMRVVSDLGWYFLRYYRWQNLLVIGRLRFHGSHFFMYGIERLIYSRYILFYFWRDLLRDIFHLFLDHRLQLVWDYLWRILVMEQIKWFLMILYWWYRSYRDLFVGVWMWNLEMDYFILFF
jgi:hypothetical protein